MTQKALIKLASDETAMYLLEEIARIQSNMCYKTVYEQAKAKREMRELAAEVIDLLADLK